MARLISPAYPITSRQAMIVLIVKEEYSTGGQPSPTLTHVVTSLKFA